MSEPPTEPESPVATDQPDVDLAAAQRLRTAHEDLREQVGRVIVGQQEVVEEPAQSQTRSIDLRYADFVYETGSSPYALEIQDIIPLQIQLKEIQNSKLLRAHRVMNSRRWHPDCAARRFLDAPGP